MHNDINIAQEGVMIITEKMIIAPADPKVLLNKRAELVSKCCHRNKFVLNSAEKKSCELAW